MRKPFCIVCTWWTGPRRVVVVLRYSGGRAQKEEPVQQTRLRAHSSCRSSCTRRGGDQERRCDLRALSPDCLCDSFHAHPRYKHPNAGLQLRTRPEPGHLQQAFVKCPKPNLDCNEADETSSSYPFVECARTNGLNLRGYASSA